MTDHKILIDTSFLVNLLGLRGEQEAERCKKYIQNAKIVAPYLMQYEVGNPFLKFKLSEPKLFFDLIELLEIEFRMIEESPEVYQVAEKYTLSFYDASYISLLKSDKTIRKFLTYDTDFKNVADKRVAILS